MSTQPNTPIDAQKEIADLKLQVAQLEKKFESQNRETQRELEKLRAQIENSHNHPH